MEAKDILNLPMSPNDAEAVTVRDYFKALLTALLEQEEGFSGKRPFGNSGWTSDLEISLVKGGAVDGLLDDDGFISQCDSRAATKALLEAVSVL